MAEGKEEIDLNELDSIDALLEEAEQALDSAEPEVSEEAPDPVEEPTVAEPPAEMEEAVEAPDEPVEAPAPVEEKAPEPAPEPEPPPPASAPDPEPVEAGPPPEPADKPEPVASKAVEDKPLPAEMKRTGGKKNSELTDADMDKLKKLILAFGISLIVMVLVGWGLSIWAAIAASSTHLDEETMTLLEEIKTGVEHVAVKSEKQDKTLAAVEKKIDALSFQIEQLNADMGKLEELLGKGVPVAAKAVKPAHGKGHDKPAAPAMAHEKPAAPAAQAVATLDPDVKKTLGSINSRLIRTQKKVEQVYSRLARLQAQYKAMLAAVRRVEKGLKAAKKPAKKQTQLREPYYQYRAPSDYPFDPAHVDSYP